MGPVAAGPARKVAPVPYLTVPSASPAPTTPSAPAVSCVEDGRRRIDQIDADLRALIAARKEVSRQVQALRAAAGGPRIQHARENYVVAGYARELGPCGVEIARALLTLCRGGLGTG